MACNTTNRRDNSVHGNNISIIWAVVGCFCFSLLFGCHNFLLTVTILLSQPEVQIFAIAISVTNVNREMETQLSFNCYTHIEIDIRKKSTCVRILLFHFLPNTFYRYNNFFLNLSLPIL